MSSRAITSEMLKEIYAVKEKPCNKVPRPIQQIPHRDRSLDDWGGPRARTQAHAITTLAFVCLLRSDEVLNLRIEDIRVNPRNPTTITVDLTSRKTSPFGKLISFSSSSMNLTVYPGCKPFTLWRLDNDEAHLCPVRAVARWIKISGITSGYLFRPIDVMDRVGNSPDKHLVRSHNK